MPTPNLTPPLDISEQAESPESAAQTSQNHDPVELLVWEAPNRQFDPKTPQWFLGLFAIGLVSIILFAILREVWLILLSAAIVFVYYALHRVEPSEIEHRILSTGVEVGGRLYSWEDLESFWILNQKDPATLRLETKLFFPHVLELLLPEETPDEDIEELKELLKKYLPQVEKPHSEAGHMADQAILSASGVVPYRQKLTNWLERKLESK